MAQASLSAGSRPHLPSRRLPTILAASLLALIIVAAGTVIYLSKDLPESPGVTLNYPATDFNFAFGSGHSEGEHMLVDEFANGYALLSSGPVSIQADSQRILQYTWLPPGIPQEAAFFWRRSDDVQNVLRTEITAPGTQIIDLATETDWRGEITEFGFLLAGLNGETVKLGEALLIPDSLYSRLQLTWRAWITFEEWSQQSINFLHGGDYRQVIALPLLLAAWSLITVLLLWVFSNFGKNIGSRQLLITTVMIFLLAWIMLDIRWSANNLHQIKLSLQNQWQLDDQQRASMAMDGEIYQYVRRLKSEVLGEQPARILILGDENAIDYYLLRAKYHLLPHSVAVSGRFANKLVPESLDFVIFFGQATNIMKIPGWNSSWQQSLVPIDRGGWGQVYRVKYRITQ